MRSLIFISAFLLSAASAFATTYTAASCNEADVAAALALAAGGDTVQIPAGTCTWTTQLSYTAPGAITIIGAGNQTVVGGGDATVIINHTGLSSMMLFSEGLTNAEFRFSGITIKQDAGSTPTNNGVVALTGNTPNLRVDHCHFWIVSETGSNLMGIVYGAMFGVFDHNLFDMTPGGVDNGVRVKSGSAFGDASGNGNGSWSNPTAFGTANFVFFEDNVFNFSISNDCIAGGRQVFRHNTFNDASIQTHEMSSDDRGCRATEVYQNTYNGSATDGVNSFTAVGYRMGTGLVWGNISTNMRNLITIGNDRTNGHPFLAPPASWGYCGTLGVNPGPSNWDQNTNSTGYACIDQPGRGQSDVLQGQFPTKCNVTLNPACNVFTGQWPRNKQEPIYEWLNEYQIGATQNQIYFNEDTNTFSQNRDYYAYTLAWNGSSFTGTAFNGTVGTGSGTLAARPATCTPLTAYWETDHNQLDYCYATNTWSTLSSSPASYAPFGYPHPLVCPTVNVATTDNLQALVNNNSACTTFVLASGVHHDSVTALKTGNTFIGTTGAIENGATTLTGWTSVLIGGVTYWTTAGGTPIPTTYTSTHCFTGFLACFYPQDFYLDSVTYTHVTTLGAVTGTGKWYFDYLGGDGGVVNNIYLASGENPNSHVTELGTTKTLFQSSTATGIKIKNLIWEKFAGDIDHGPVSACFVGDTGCSASGWIIQNNEARLNRMEGISLHGNTHPQSMTVTGNLAHHNGQYGVAFGADNSFLTGNTLYNNNVDNVSCGYGAGGEKAVGSTDAITGNTAYSNLCNGLWTDQGSSHHTYDHNLVYGNVGEGIRYEISDFGVITNNTIYANGPGQDGSVGYQVDYSSSSHGTIQANTITTGTNQRGIKVEYNANRAGPPILPVSMSVTGNKITTPVDVLMAAAIDTSSPSMFGSWGTPGMFDSNCYIVPSLAWASFLDWKFGATADPSLNFAAWQGSPNLNDVHGILSTTGCSGPTPPAQLKIEGIVQLRGHVIVK